MTDGAERAYLEKVSAFLEAELKLLRDHSKTESREVRERTRGQRIVFYIAVAAAALVVILILWFIFHQEPAAAPAPEDAGSAVDTVKKMVSLMGLSL